MATRWWVFFVVLAATLSKVVMVSAAEVSLPMSCSRGPSAQSFHASVTMPDVRPAGSTFTVRIDSVSSGRIYHLGLNSLHDMATDYRLSPGARFVEGSAHFVPGSGTPNVRPNARVWHDAAGIHTLLPAHVANDSSYTPPSVEFDVALDTPAPDRVWVEFVHYSVMAHVFLLGHLRTTCDPRTRPATIGVTRVEAAASH